MSGPFGPFDTEADALALPAVQAVYAALRAAPGAGRMAPHSHRLLMDAVAGAAVQLGGYDRRILGWLARWKPQAVAVVAGLITRAHMTGLAVNAGLLEEARDVLLDEGTVTLTASQAATVLAALADAETYRAAGFCGDREAAQGYHDLAAELGGAS